MHKSPNSDTYIVFGEARKRTWSNLSSRQHLQLEDLREVGLLGTGGFGRVALVKHVSEDTVYALKSLDKSRAVRMLQVEQVMSERSILLLCSHPFLLKLVAKFQDRWGVHLLTDVALGGDLFSLIEAFPRGMPEERVSFYTANVACVRLNRTRSREAVLEDRAPLSPATLG